jgi:hypothetical protein
MDKTNEQFFRVKRWQERLKEISIGRADTRASDYYEDILYAFFQNCFHLKDWIVNSGALSKNVVEDFINSNTDMKICRDLCNGSKHLIINNPSIGKNVSIVRRDYSLSIGGGPAEIKVHYSVNAGGLPLDAYSLAESCVIHWEVFLKEHDLINKG